MSNSAADEEQRWFLQRAHRIRSPDSASTYSCSSHSSESCSDSEEDDAGARWPWIDYIKENGDLFYLEPDRNDFPVQTQPMRRDFPQPAKNTSASHKNLGFSSRISRVLSGGKVDTKKWRADHGHSNTLTAGTKIKNGHIRSATIGQRRKADYDFLSQFPSGETEHRLICKNVLVGLNEEIAEGFVSLENILGIISGLDLESGDGEELESIISKGQSLGRLNPDAIIVQGVIPASPVGRSELILIGDILKAINGTSVDQINIKDQLRKINGSAQVILTIERLVPLDSSLPPKSPLLELVTVFNHDFQKSAVHAAMETCCVMFLTLNTNEDDPESDTIFSYPDSGKSMKLKAIKGMFLTIGDLMKNVSGTEVQSSSLVIDHELIHTFYKKLDGNLLVIAVPDSKASMSQLLLSAGELTTLFAVLYGSAERAFESEHREEASHLIVLYLEQLLSSLPLQIPTGQVHRTGRCFCGVRQLQLPVAPYVEISNVLSDSEAADYGVCANDFYPHRRLYSTLGTCLFYKGHLVCNHLMDEDLVDFMLICKYFCLFYVTSEESLHELVLWKEVFLTRRNKVEQQDGVASDYQEPIDARCFLLVVGQKHSLLCTLLEAGGAASIPVGNPGPHPYYVDTAMSILTYLHESLGFERLCETRLTGPSTPALARPAEILNPKTSQSPRAIELTNRKIPAHPESVQGSASDYATEARHSVDQRSVDSPSAENASTTSGSSSNVESPLAVHRGSALDSASSDWRRDSTSTTSSFGSALPRASGSISSQHLNQSFAKGAVSSIPMIEPPMRSRTAAVSTKLTYGSYNTLFYYAAVRKPLRLIICPNESAVKDALTKNVLRSFHAACEEFSRVFEKNQKLPDVDRVTEQGTLFRSVSSKGVDGRKTPALKYWVAGRLVDDEEIYVCYDESVPQTMVEMAFKLRFGMHT